MTDIADHLTRLGQAIKWTGAGAATALAALLVMLGAWGLEGSTPRADNVGETGIALAMGIFGLVLSLVVSIPAGLILARGTERKEWLRALPLLVSVAWLGLVVLLLYTGASSAIVEAAWRSSGIGALSPLFVFSVYTAGAIPIGVGLLIAWFVLVIVRASKRPVSHSEAPLPHMNATGSSGVPVRGSAAVLTPGPRRSDPADPV
ncbi:hypothetical protein ACFVAE_01680 [Microbacterium sp. NPDC057659]|uniref:hypothetical protein n=1 Tax=Microbacterium sp. NPDC057659 TaxID=3346198 RepID=UPI00366C13CB